MADTRENAVKSFDFFVNIYEVKYPKAAMCPEKDRDVLLNFYDFPATHWRHIRTSNPIEQNYLQGLKKRRLHDFRFGTLLPPPKLLDYIT